MVNKNILYTIPGEEIHPAMRGYRVDVIKGSYGRKVLLHFEQEFSGGIPQVASHVIGLTTGSQSKFTQESDIVEKLRKLASEEYRQLPKSERDTFRLQRETDLSARLGIFVLTFVGLVGAGFFLSSNITGNVIGSLSSSSTNILGIIFLVLALVGGFFWVRGKKKLEIKKKIKKKK